ncbi:MAG TPA: DUF167 domain-containing protein [Candidatus Acidoferrum sp.]|jgi:uncharacterized protein (TIGR00251 family)|nr:DUF167 domain-containing protein [Candidatus Acidoferrum sp.]
MSYLDVTENSSRSGVLLAVRVQPRASRDEVAGAIEGALKIRLCAPAVDNRANEALTEFLAAVLKVPKSSVRILSGERGRTKRVEITGVTRQQVVNLLQTEA